MRFTLAGTAVVVLLSALVVAVVIGIGNAPLPTEAELTLVELGTDDDGQPVVVVGEAPSGDLRDLVGELPTAVVAHDQLICIGGSLVDADAGDAVSVTGIVEVRDGPPVTVIADRVIIECGGG